MADNNFDDFKLDKQMRMSGNVPEDKSVFYDLARSRIIYQTRSENIAWNEKYKGLI